MSCVKVNSSFAISRRFREFYISIFKYNVAKWYLHLERVFLFVGIFRTRLNLRELFHIHVEREYLSGDAEWFYKLGLVLHLLK